MIWLIFFTITWAMFWKLTFYFTVVALFSKRRAGVRFVWAVFLCLFLSLYCWIWYTNHVIASVPMPLVPANSTYVLLKYEFFYGKHSVLNVSINFEIYGFDTCSIRLLVCHFKKNFVFDSRFRALYKKKILWVNWNLWSSQEKTIEIYSYSERLFMRKKNYPVH